MDLNIRDQIKKLEPYFKQKTLVGIKLYPGYQYFYPFDKKVYPIAQLCQKYNKPLIFHSGDVYDPKNKALLKYSHPLHIDELAVNFPQCKIVISHFGFPFNFETATVVSKNDNVYTDISATIDASDTKEEADNIYAQYKADLTRIFNYFPNIIPKVMFGTDYGGEHTPLREVMPYIKLVKELFKPNEQKAVYYQTAEKVYFQ